MIARGASMALIVAMARPAMGEPLRLRADALATTSTASPVGLVDLQAGGAVSDWLRADAIVWLGSADSQADVLVIAARATAPRGLGEATAGRFVLNVGALRPLHLDGVDAHAHLPHRLELEAFGGAPVMPGFGPRSWDWLAGGRAGRRLGDWGSAGVAYLEERDHGELSTQELGLDAGGALDAKSDASARLAIDLIARGVALAQVSAVRRVGAIKLEVYAVHRSPSHLIPATSLFSVLGDLPSQRAGGRMTWRAAPRLDLDLDLGARRAADAIGADLVGRATLRLDDTGRGALSLELRRDGAANTGWTGARGAARVPIGTLIASTELELARPDDAARGGWWPWALAAIGWRGGDWDAAIAIEASASPEYRHRVDGLVRVSRRWEAP